ncbi:MAG: acyl-CoA dehydrogenase [Candidatus Hydrogenedentota bacterium]|nr:MAG: acyl-CoA dehydrogenase [Candidatus Hydrogenedentota bacterium]
MSDKLVNRRDIDFNLYEVLNVEELTKHAYFEDHSKETFDMALDAAYQLAQEKFWPMYQIFDQEGVKLENGQAIVPEGMHEIWKDLREGGWFAASNDYELGGQQFPSVVQLVCSMMFNAANTTASMYLGLTYGAAHLLSSCASDELKKKYIEKMFSGEYGGTMCLTEPQAGTSLSDISTSATPVDGEDYYIIRGTKRFISSGDHDLADNIIHPVLARIEGAEAGVKGISLFLVPKYDVNDDGTIGDSNDVLTASLEHKLGLRGQATAELIFGEKGACKGWLVGNENMGLNYMFQMMNGARLHTGVQAISQASAAYYCALQYTHEREQGRAITSKDTTTPQIPIIEHPEVRRMLLKQKAYIEGVLGLLLYCSKQTDIMRVSKDTDEDAYNKASGILELLTPICKAYGSDVACESISIAIQCYGGSGYIEEFPVAQMFRDSRVFPIYEGTNQIQAMDLLGRKIPMRSGMYFQDLMGEMGTTIEEASEIDDLKDMAGKVQQALETVADCTMHLGAIGMSGEVDRYISHASPYLQAFSQLVVAWRFLGQSIVANQKLQDGSDDVFYVSKLATAKYYINAILPSTHTICQGIKNEADTALNFEEAWF